MFAKCLRKLWACEVVGVGVGVGIGIGVVPGIRFGSCVFIVFGLIMNTFESMIVASLMISSCTGCASRAGTCTSRYPCSCWNWYYR